MANFEEALIGTVQAQETNPTPAGQTAKGGPLGMFLPMILVFAIFYLLMIRPQQKQKKQHQTLLQGMKKGDEAVTTSGIHGRVFGIADTLVTLEIAENIRIKIDKQQIATIKPPATPS